MRSHVGTALQWKRLQLLLTQEQVADMLAIEWSKPVMSSYVSRVEHEEIEITPDLLDVFCTIFSCAAEEILAQAEQFQKREQDLLQRIRLRRRRRR